MRIRTITFASIAVIGMGIPFMATSAQAVKEPRHCVVNTSDTNALMVCYDSFTVAIAKATGGWVTDAPDNARQAASDPRLEAELNSRARNAGGKPATQAVGPIEIAYDDVGFEGRTWIFTADHDCTSTLNDIDFSVVAIDSGIRSYRNYRGCLSKHYEFANFGGRSVGWDGGGELPFPAKSIQWS